MASVELGHTTIAMQPEVNGEASMQRSAGVPPLPIHDALPVQPPTKSKHFDNKAKRQQLGMRSWLKVDSSGEIQFVLLDKYKVVHEYGVQLRDLRILDPNLATTYPSAILCREKALIVNIEHIRLIITPESVMVRNAEDAPVTQFVEMLKRRLAQQPAAWNASMGNINGSPTSLGNAGLSMGNLAGMVKEDGGDRNGPGAVQELKIFTQQFPFELRALEVCLEQVGTCPLPRFPQHRHGRSERRQRPLSQPPLVWASGPVGSCGVQRHCGAAVWRSKPGTEHSSAAVKQCKSTAAQQQFSRLPEPPAPPRACSNPTPSPDPYILVGTKRALSVAWGAGGLPGAPTSWPPAVG
jgi:hypothetical protein